MTETIHLIYEISAIAAIFLGGGWKLISFLNKKFERQKIEMTDLLEVEMAQFRTEINHSFSNLGAKIDIVSRQVSQLGGLFDELEADTISMDRRLIVLETVRDERNHSPMGPIPAQRRARRKKGE